MASAPSRPLNSHSITRLATYPSLSSPTNSSDESRLKIPFRDGPTFFSSVSALWHPRHCSKSSLPFEAGRLLLFSWGTIRTPTRTTLTHQVRNMIQRSHHAAGGGPSSIGRASGRARFLLGKGRTPPGERIVGARAERRQPGSRFETRNKRGTSNVFFITLVLQT